MDGVLWLRIVDIFHAALERPQAEQAAFVAAASDGNGEVEREVLAMLDEDRRGVSRLQRGIGEAAGEAFGESIEIPAYVPPERIGPYERREFLGRGGMGAVWKAVRSDTRLPAAIKVLLPLDPLPAALRKRFAGEINALARLRHPHIVSFHDAGVLDDGTPWFVMDYVEEYVRGMAFTAYCRLPGRSIQERLRLFRVVCEAVLYAHLQGIIHRDLKPSNILIAKDGSPRIVDFGIARELQASGGLAEATLPSERFMSPGYAAPEWKDKGEVGVYTDVYSLGIILYEMLAGRHPYRKPPQASGVIDEQGWRNLPERPSVAAQANPSKGDELKLARWAWKDLDNLCLMAMHPDLRQRYASVESLLRDVDHYLTNEPLDAQPGLLLYRAGKFLRRHRRAVLATVTALALVVSMASAFMWQLARERNQAVAEAARVRHIQDFMTNLLQGGDQNAGPAANLPVTAMIDRGVKEADTLSDEPMVQADLYQTLGTMSQKLGRLDQAEILLERSLKERRSLRSPDPAEIASTQIALAMVWSDEGKTKEAVRLVQRSLDEIRSHATSSKVSIGKAQLALGNAMIAAGEQSRAIGILRQAISTIQTAEGSRSADLARALGTLADAEVYSANYDVADSLNRKALAIDRAVYGENHPHVADDLGDLAQSLEVRGYYAQAETLEREALAIMEKWYGPDHPETARKLTTLASTLTYEDKNTEAHKLLERALAIQERVYGPQHPRVAYVLNAMASVELGERAFQAAERDDSRVADIYRQAYGDQDYRVAVALGNLASVYQAEKHYAKCESLLLDVIGRFTRAVGARNINTGMARVRLGMALLQDGKYRASVEQSLAGYEILDKQMNPDSGWIEGARRDLAEGYTELGEAQNAEEFRAKPATVTASASR
jgi:eukaryotic-like serine/threonine-protein kinase